MVSCMDTAAGNPGAICHQVGSRSEVQAFMLMLVKPKGWKEPGSLMKSLSHRISHPVLALLTVFLFWKFINISIVSIVEGEFPPKLQLKAASSENTLDTTDRHAWEPPWVTPHNWSEWESRIPSEQSRISFYISSYLACLHPWSTLDWLLFSPTSLNPNSLIFFSSASCWNIYVFSSYYHWNSPLDCSKCTSEKEKESGRSQISPQLTHQSTAQSILSCDLWLSSSFPLLFQPHSHNSFTSWVKLAFPGF